MSVDDGLRPLFRKHVPKPMHWTTIETRLSERGIPDSNFCSPRPGGPGVEGWVEFKATKGWEVLLRPEQIGWLTTRARHGGRVFVAVRRRCSAGRRREAADELYLLSGQHAAYLREHGLRPWGTLFAGPPAPSGLLLGSWAGGPARWHWPAVRAALLGSPSAGAA